MDIQIRKDAIIQFLKNYYEKHNKVPILRPLKEKEFPCTEIEIKTLFGSYSQLRYIALGTKSRMAHHKSESVFCKNCNTSFEKKSINIRNTKNNFCSRSCAATYNNKHKNYGTRRSKLEIYIEKRLVDCFPDLSVVCNSKAIIGSELDFYFPNLRLAVELNGPTHYEPIYRTKYF